MLLTIVIPTLNRPEYLNQILRSIHKQVSKTLTTEVIVIDDRSKEKKLIKNRQICSKNKVKLIEQKTSLGSGEARNTGINQSRGQWIAFLDDDVILTDNWFSNVINRINSLESNVIGIEGKVISKGKGLWDREVENLYGGLYLTANIIYRKKELIEAGYFDKYFLKYGEDQELAIRMKSFGTISFDPSITVIHLPRNINFKNIILDSINRIQSLLNSEYLLYKKHPAHYHTIRYAYSFWGTLVNTTLKHTIISLKRRSFKDLIKNPFQSFYLIFSLILEQIGSLIFLPKFIIKELNKPISIQKFIDIEKSVEINQITTTNFLNLITAPQPPQILKRLLSGKRCYKNLFNNINNISKLEKPNIILRIDDLFLKNSDTIDKLCTIMNSYKVSFIAGITLEDLEKQENHLYIKKIIDSGGIISTHGITHEGKYGPYPSEILQLNRIQINDICKKSYLLKSQIFIPPFNAISWDQIEQLSSYFTIICGGPESGRFTNHLSIPVILKTGSLYLPSLPPYYSTSKELLVNNQILNLNGLKSITLHLNNESEDNFISLNILLSKYEDYFINIEEFMEILANG